MKIHIVNESGHPIHTKLYNENGEQLTHVTALRLDMTRDHIECEMDVTLPTVDMWAEIAEEDVAEKLKHIKFFRQFLDETEAELLRLQAPS